MSDADPTAPDWDADYPSAANLAAMPDTPSELKLCPWCAENGILDVDYQGAGLAVCCCVCGALGPATRDGHYGEQERAEARRLWNTRAGEEKA